MRTISALLLASLLAAPIVACNGPFVLLPGGALEGSTAPTPASWACTDEVNTIQLETRPADPYSVNIWVIALGEHLYVHAGANRSEWVEHMEADPNGRRPRNENVVGACLFRLGAR